MYSKSVLFWMYVFITIVLSCTDVSERSGIPKIDLESGGENRVLLNLSQYADSVWYIALESGSINLKVLQLLDKRGNLIVVSDKYEVSLFTDQGKFLSKIGFRGRGPGEYRYVTNLKLSLNGTVLVQDMYDLLEYDLDGVFLKSFRDFFRYPTSYQLVHSEEWLQLSDSLFLLHLPVVLGNEEHRALVKDKEGSVIRYIPNFNRFDGRPASDSWSTSASVYTFSQRIYYHEMFSDTLFELDNNYCLQPRLHFNRGKYYVSYVDVINGILNQTLGDFQMAYIKNLFETRRFLFLDVEFILHDLRRTVIVTVDGLPKKYYSTKLLGVYEKDKDLFQVAEVNREGEYRIRQTGLINDFDGGFSFYPAFRFDDNTLAMQIDAFKLKGYVNSDGFREAATSHQEKKKALQELANSLSDEDNPVLMVVSFK